MGGAYASNYYIQNLENAEDVVALEVRAVGIDGTESTGTRVALASDNRVSGIRTVSADNKLTVTWTDPSEDFASVEVALDYWYSDTTNKDQTATAVKGDQKVVFDIDLDDGAQYVLSVTTVNEDGTKNETVNFFGDLVDNYCDPYDGEARVESAGKVNMTVPGASDWFTLAMEINGKTTTYKRFGGSMMRRISIPTSGISTMTITVTDIDGNVSEPVTQMFLDGMPANLDDAFGEDMIPDAKLREALQEKAGPTLGDLLDFTGALDLSNLVIKDLTGLNILTGITELNVSGTFITEITASQIPAGVQKLTVKDCGNLKSIELDNRSNTALVLGYLPELTDLSLVGYGAFALDLSGCAKLENLYLSGSALETLDITANVKLHNFDISGSKISKLTAANASAYTNAYRWQWDNNFMDLSDSTSEGALKNGIANFFATTDISDEVSKDETQMGSAYMSYWSDQSVTIDVGNVNLLSSVKISNPYAQWYDVLTNVTIEVSTDNATFTQVAAQTEGEADSTIVLPEGTKAQYVRITNVDGVECYARITVYGYEVAPKGFTYGGQKPAVVRDDVQEMTVPADNATYQLLDLLDASYASTRTLKGNLLSGMTEADWIDAAYLAAQGTAPKGVKVVITDSASNPYEYPTEGPKLGQIEDTKLNVPAETVYANSQYSGEEGYRMFDGSTKSKWCGSEYGNWLVFELEEARVIGQWYTMHAGVEGNGMISAAFRLQTLNTEVVSEEDYLAMSESEKRNVARNASNWVDLDVVTDNTENEVTREIELDSLKQAQVYRFVVDQAAQPDGNSWGALRVYEMELYAYSGQLGANTNGLLKANTVDTYTVSYTKSKVEIANTTVTVRVPTVDEVIALIDAIGTPITVDSKDAIKAARVAYDNLSEDDQKLVTNYETLVQAEADYLALADAVEALIDAIGFVTLDSGDAIAAAREAYDTLPAELQELVANYETLLKAEQAYAYLLEVKDLTDQAEAAKAAAEEAQAAAEAAKEAAEAAQAAAEEAAASAAEDREAAEAAQAKAGEAQAKAEAAQAAAEAAQAAAEEAQAAAEEANAEAAEHAAKAAEEAAKAATEAAAAAESAASAAESAAAAQAAQAAAEAAAKTAEEAQAAAEEAQKKAEEAAESAGVDSDEAKKAADAAKAAQEAAEAAQKAAEEAAAAAEESRKAAEASNKEAAESAALAAEYAQKVAEAYAEIVKIKAEIIDSLAEAQKAAEEAKQAALSSAKYYALIQLSQIDTSDMNADQKAATDEVIAAARADVDEATTPEEVEEILANALAEIEAIRETKCAAEDFVDVNAAAWYHESVDFMYNNGFMNGTGTTTFEPYKNLTRGELVTILYRVAGEPEVSGAAGFVDVPENAFYTNAVIWAAENGITNGYADNTFRPKQDVTRQEMVTFLYRFAKAEAVEEDHLTGYPDAGNVYKFAQESMNWAIANGIVNGVVVDGEAHLLPEATAARAEAAAIVARYLTAE